MFPIIIMDMDDPTDRAFMCWVYDEYYRLMFATAHKYISAQQDCEDIVQDSFVSLIRNVDSMQKRDRSHLTAYIVITVRNKTIDFMRRNARSKNFTISLEDNYYELENTEDGELPIEELLLLSEQSKRLTEIWPQLSEGDQFLLGGKYVLEYSDQQLAKDLNCKVNSVRMKLTRARRRAYRLMVEDEKPEGGEES